MFTQDSTEDIYDDDNSTIATNNTDDMTFHNNLFDFEYETFK